MEFGIGIATSGESWKLSRHAEELGFTHARFHDTQMIRAAGWSEIVIPPPPGQEHAIEDRARIRKAFA